MEPGELPGDVWHLMALECHVLLAAIRRLRPFLDPDERELQIWEQSLGTTSLQVTPFDTDRVLFELLAAAETAHLWSLDADTQLACGHSPDDHIRILRGFNEREIIRPKAFARQRRERDQAARTHKN